jgi:MoaA/NifB/PqqE/SkfB family radical SAM enzyme
VDCTASREWGDAQMRKAVERATTDRVPFTVSFDVTHRCNLRCVHCYAGHSVDRSSAEAAELGTDDAVRLLGQIAEAGCLELTLSGGEPLLRPDFAVIYAAARQVGMLVTVFSNATLVGEGHLAVFAEYPPAKVDVSIYGATAETYQHITGVTGSYERARRGVDRLLERGVRVGLKTMILRENADEIGAMEALAEGLGVSFRLDPLVTPRLDGDIAPLAHRVEPERAVALELGVAERCEDLRTYADGLKGTTLPRRHYHCGAGLTSCNVDPAGVVRPCMLSKQPAFDATSLGFEGAWSAVAAAVDEMLLPDDFACGSCALGVVCGYCPTLFGLETGDPGRHSDYVCALGEARARAIGWDAGAAGCGAQ